MLDEQRFSQVEYTWALEQLLAAGLIRRVGTDGIAMTVAGIDYCWSLEKRMGVQLALLFDVYHNAVRAAADQEEVQ